MIRKKCLRHVKKAEFVRKLQERIDNSKRFMEDIKNP